MPRAHTAEERERIEAALIETGHRAFVRGGLAKTSVAQLARGAGIGKGTFYQFFESKEALFFAVLEREEERFDAGLEAELEQASGGAQAVRTLLLAVADRMEQQPFLRLLLEPELLAALMTRLPPAQVEAHRATDRQRYQAIFERWQARGWVRADLDLDDAFAVLTATFMLSLQREPMGEAAYRRAIIAIAEAMTAQWCESDE